MSSILFLDQSTNKVGYAVYASGSIFATGLIVLADKNAGTDYKSHAERRRFFAKELVKLVNRFGITQIFYEGVFATSNIETFKKLSKVQGTVEDFSVFARIDYEEFGSNVWRKHLDIKPVSRKRADVKKAVCDFVDEHFPELVLAAEDTKEAVAMGYAWHKKEKE